MNKNNYYTVGISGHRDLLPSQYDENLTILKGHLLKLRREHPDKQILVLTPLAEGADRLIAKVAMELNIPYDVFLPMPKELYIQDFSKNSQKEFEHYLLHAKKVETIPLYAGNTLELIRDYSVYRDFQYRQVGRKIVDLADEMIIMSDEQPNNKIGGTYDIANYAKMYGKIIYKVRCDRLCA